ncbi:energy transducer TonB [Flavobacterium taihuense]|uniref:Energy transducer TonB n=1 Tax=Flavobacterium taihuense TaxID=2857508 RepID=A0ABS6Y3B8_9FLAO|nr:energy transducer TonB [Flavobacterium taihuense]MBW4362553.1 energy transducer TonB [Flavobacterium taihuense]
MKRILLLVIILFGVNFASAQATATIVDDAPYNYEDVEVRPEFPGGYNELMNFIGKNFKMPEYEGNGGVLKVAFVIEVDGSVTNVKVVKDLGEGTGAEAKRVISASPRWSSGEFRGKKVRVLYELPIKIASQG